VDSYVGEDWLTAVLIFADYCMQAKQNEEKVERRKKRTKRYLIFFLPEKFPRVIECCDQKSDVL
jgi:hypothetical protein